MNESSSKRGEHDAIDRLARRIVKLEARIKELEDSRASEMKEAADKAYGRAVYDQSQSGR